MAGQHNYVKAKKKRYAWKFSYFIDWKQLAKRFLHLKYCRKLSEFHHVQTVLCDGIWEGCGGRHGKCDIVYFGDRVERLLFPLWAARSASLRLVPEVIRSILLFSCSPSNVRWPGDVRPPGHFSWKMTPERITSFSVLCFWMFSS